MHNKQPTSLILEEFGVIRPGVVLFDTLKTYLVLFVGITLFGHTTQLEWRILAVVIIGTQQYALTTLSHDGRHGVLFLNKRLNEWFTLLLLAAPFGANFRGERLNHNLHHNHLSTENDPDQSFHSHDGKDTLPSFFLFIIGARSISGAINRIFVTDDRHSTFAENENLRDLFTIIVVQSGIALLFWAHLGWESYFLAWLLPIYLFTFLPHTYRRFCEHARFSPDLPQESSQPSLVSYRPTAIEKLFISRFGIQYHGEHHLFPSVPYYNLKHLAHHLAGHPEIEYRQGYVSFSLEWIKRICNETLKSHTHVEVS